MRQNLGILCREKCMRLSFDMSSLVTAVSSAFGLAVGMMYEVQTGMKSFNCYDYSLHQTPRHMGGSVTHMRDI